MRLIRQLWKLEASVGDVAMLWLAYVVVVQKPWVEQVHVFVNGGVKAWIGHLMGL